jgi:hypothetical protein
MYCTHCTLPLVVRQFFPVKTYIIKSIKLGPTNFQLFNFGRGTWMNCIMQYGDCRSLVVVLSLSKWKVVSSSPARACRVNLKTFKIGSDCSFAKSTAFRSENHRSFRYDLKNGGLMLQTSMNKFTRYLKMYPQIKQIN